LLSAKRPCAESFGSGSRHRTKLSVEAAFPVVATADRPPHPAVQRSVRFQAREGNYLTASAIS
jgi:hypothetical protein